MLDTRRIKNILKEKGLRVNKRLGQNFLISQRIRDSLIKFCDINKDDIVLEIGPGLGALTEAVLPLCRRLVAVEKDRSIALLLKELFPDRDRIEIVNTDILEYDINGLYEKYGEKLKVIGNLPFYITTPVIFRLIDHKRCIASAYITVQKEVAERIAACCGRKDYGILSCMVQYHCQVFVKARLLKSDFFPQPKVDASFLKLDMRQKPAVAVSDEKFFFNLIKGAFNQRRKTVFNSLSKSPIVDIDRELLKSAFEKSGLDPNARAERLSLADFAALSNAISGS